MYQPLIHFYNHTANLELTKTTLQMSGIHNIGLLKERKTKQAHHLLHFGIFLHRLFNTLRTIPNTQHKCVVNTVPHYNPCVNNGFTFLNAFLFVFSYNNHAKHALPCFNLVLHPSGNDRQSFRL